MGRREAQREGFVHDTFQVHLCRSRAFAPQVLNLTQALRQSPSNLDLLTVDGYALKCSGHVRTYGRFVM
jgi:hypothetical protein